MEPRVVKFWPEYARCVYLERVAIMLEANNLPMDNEPPLEIVQEAMKCAEMEMLAVEGKSGRPSVNL